MASCLFRTPQTVLFSPVVIAFQGAFYYLQACDMEIIKVFHARDESSALVNLKKGIATAFSHKLVKRGELPLPALRTVSSRVDSL